MRPLKIILYAGGWDVAPWREALARHVPSATVLSWPTDARADYAAVWAPPPAMFEGQRDLRAVFSLSAGVDHLAAATGALRGMSVVRIEDAGMADQMVEYVLLAALMKHRRWGTYAAQQSARRWQRHDARPRADLVAGVMGLGVLGGAVGRALADFGYTVRGWSRRARAVDGVRTFAGEGELAEFLAPCELLVDMLPLTPATESLLDRRVLSMLPRGAALVNVARGKHLVEEDLVALLDEGHLEGATLDVFRHEPLADESPLWRHPRVTVTPHVAAISVPERCVAQVAEKIARFEAGLAVTGLVDLDAMY
jgi:glyoxylate/hydroxypyruvate reductase A